MENEKYLYTIKNNIHPKKIKYTIAKWAIDESQYSRTQFKNNRKC